MTSVTPTRRRSRGGDFATLSREVRRAGLLDRRRGYYLVRIVGNLAVFAAGWAAFVAIGDSWWQLLTAVFFAAMFTQLAFIGHDAGHKQIFRGRRGNDAVGYLHGGLVGLSYAQALVQDFCDRHRIDYAQCGLARSYAHVLRHLHDTGTPLRHHKEARTT